MSKDYLRKNGVYFSSGMNLKEMEKRAVELGCRIVVVKGTGEKRLSHTLMQKPVTYNLRKKHSPREATGFLRKLLSKLPSSAPAH